MTIRVRRVRERDADALLNLEQKVWRPAGVAPITRATFYRWHATYRDGFFVAMRGATLCGYAYHERVHFEPILPFSPALEHLIKAGHTDSHHQEAGNALFGVSIATYPRGAGAGRALAWRVLRHCRPIRASFLITLSRMPGLRRFLRDTGGTSDVTGYVRATTELVQTGTTTVSPAPRHPDMVLGWFIHNLGMEVHAIVQSSFSDPESANRAAFLIRRLTPEV